MRLKYIMVAIAAILVMVGCTEENSFEKVKLPHTDISGTYSLTMDLNAGPFAPFVLDHVDVLVYNTASNNDSIWIDDSNFWESKLKVLRNGNKFTASGGADIFHGEVVNLTGEFFPEKDSIHIEWTYLQGGDPADDHVVFGDGSLVTGL